MQPHTIELTDPERGVLQRTVFAEHKRLEDVRMDWVRRATSIHGTAAMRASAQVEVERIDAELAMVASLYGKLMTRSA